MNDNPRQNPAYGQLLFYFLTACHVTAARVAVIASALDLRKVNQFTLLARQFDYFGVVKIALTTIVLMLLAQQ